MKVSVVIAAASGERVLSNCVAALRRAAGNEDIELIVLPSEQGKIFQVRGLGIEQAAGDRIAVLGDRYEVTPEWLEALRASGWAVTGGCIAPGPGLGYWGWCVYLCEYLHVAPPMEAGIAREAKLVPGGNVSYSREIVRQHPLSRAKSEWSFHASLIEAAASVGHCPALEVRFAGSPGFREYIDERFCLSRAIGAEGGAGKIPIALALPVVLPIRIALTAIRKRRYGRFLLCLPLIFLVGVVQAVGEFVGAFERPSKKT
jgi:hypothetical protein